MLLSPFGCTKNNLLIGHDKGEKVISQHLWQIHNRNKPWFSSAVTDLFRESMSVVLINNWLTLF